MDTVVRIMLIDFLDMTDMDTKILVNIHDDEANEGQRNIYWGPISNYPYRLFGYLYHTVESFKVSEDRCLIILLREDKDDDRNDAV